VAEVDNNHKRGDLNVIIMKGKCDAMWEKELKALDVSANRLLKNAIALAHRD
jgi:hypothetical protein